MRIRPWNVRKEARWMGAAAAAACVLLSGSANAQGWQWADGLGTNSLVSAGVVAQTACVFNDGSGAALYVGGSINNVADQAAGGVIKWDGERWTALPLLWYANNRATIYSMVVFDDGTGPALYVGGFVTGTTRGGQQTPGIAKWNGTEWLDVGGGLSFEGYGSSGFGAMALLVHDDGTGSALYAAGPFLSAGGVQCNGIAKWNGTTWQAFTRPDFNVGVLSGSGTQCIFALEAFDTDGAGPNPSEIYLGGDLSGGSVQVMRWDGLDFQLVNTGPAAPRFGITSLKTFNGALYAGNFFSTGFNDSSALIKWDGAAWTVPAPGIEIDGRSLAVFDDGSGLALYVGCGNPFGQVGENSAYVVKWDGTTAQHLGAGIHCKAINALVPWNDGQSTKLHAFGHIVDTPGILKLESGVFGPAFSPGEGASGLASAIGADIGSGLRLYAIANNGEVGSTVPTDLFIPGVGEPATGPWVVEFDGAQWRVLGAKLAGFFQTLSHVELGGGAGGLYAGGSSLVRWNGTNWETRATIGMTENTPSISAITTFDPDGAGGVTPRLVVAGLFDVIDGVSVSNVAQWDGVTWSPVGSGTNDLINKLAVFDDGTGPALYAGGKFAMAGGAPAAAVAKWDGVTWSALGTGLESSFVIDNFVTGMQPFTDAAGPGLAISGRFSIAGGNSVPGVACWRGSVLGWTSIGDGLPASNTAATVLTVWDDGTGSALYLGGIAGAATGPTGLRVVPAYIHKWSGTQWDRLTTGDGFKSVSRTPQNTPTTVNGLAPVGSGASSSLYATGGFRSVDGVPSSGLARWFQDLPTCIADFNGSGSVSVQDIFDFLAGYFGSDPRADVNQSGSITVQDIFDFLAVYFTGCP